MDKYQINLKFNENGKSLNEIIIEVLKIELEKYAYMPNIETYDRERSKI